MGPLACYTGRAALAIAQTEVRDDSGVRAQQRRILAQPEQQRQEQHRQQQITQDNARRQQEELNRSIRANTPSSSNQSVPSSGGAPAASGTGSPPSGARSAQETRQTWEKRPPLAPDRNPLLGRWYKTMPADPFPTVKWWRLRIVLRHGPVCGFSSVNVVAGGRDGRERWWHRSLSRRLQAGRRLEKGAPYGVTDLFVFDIGRGPPHLLIQSRLQDDSARALLCAEQLNTSGGAPDDQEWLVSEILSSLRSWPAL